MSSKPAFDAEKQEPKENDKCMETANNEKEESEWRRRLGDFRKRTKDFASNRYKVVLAILCVILFIFFIIIIALSVKLGTIQSATDVYCNSHDCLRAAANVALKMNATLDPCDDFYEYSCGNWIEKHSKLDRYGSYSIADQIQGEVHKRLHHLLDLVVHDQSDVSSQAEEKAQLFYSVCMKVLDVKYWSLRHFRGWITEIGGWGVIKISMPLSWNRHDVLLRLHVDHGVHPFFKFAVSADDRDPGRNVIKISPNGFGLPNGSYYFIPESNKYVRAYKDFIKDIIKEFGGTPSEASRFAENMFNYEKRIARITPVPEIVLDADNNYDLFTIQELSTISPTVEWLHLLQAYFPSANVSKATKIGLFSKDYFQGLSALLSTTDDISLNDYMMWTMVLHYLPHFPDNFKVIANRFYQTLEGVDDVNVPNKNRWEFCMEETVRYFGHALSAMYINNYFNEESRNDVQRMVDNILAELSEAVNSFPGLTNSEDKDMAQEKIRLLNMHIGYPEFITDKKKLQSYYQSYNVDGVSHIENIRLGENFLRQKEVELLKQSYNRINNPQSYAVDVRASYKYAGNSLVIPAGLLISSLYEPNMPPGTKYSFLAGYISNKLVQMFDGIGVNYEKYGRLEPWLSNRSREYYQEASKCLLQRMDVDDPKLRSNLTVLEIMNEIVGVRYAYLAHKRRDKNKGLLPGVKKDHDQSFFLSYVQYHCQVAKPQKLTVLNDPKYELRNKLRVMNALQQLPEFAAAFGCTDGSMMKSQTQCGIW